MDRKNLFSLVVAFEMRGGRAASSLFLLYITLSPMDYPPVRQKGVYLCQRKACSQTCAPRPSRTSSQKEFLLLSLIWTDFEKWAHKKNASSQLRERALVKCFEEKRVKFVRLKQSGPLREVVSLARSWQFELHAN